MSTRGGRAADSQAFAHAIRRVPVVEDGHAVGMLSIGDLALQLDQGSALADISAAPPQA